MIPKKSILYNSERIELLRTIVRDHQAHEVTDMGGLEFVVDATTAVNVLAVYDGLSPRNKARMEEMTLPEMVEVTWKVLGRVRERGAA